MTARFAGEPLNGCAICIAYLALLDRSPTRDMCAHQRLEHPPVVRVTQVKQFMNDDVVLEGLILVEQVSGQGDGSRR